MDDFKDGLSSLFAAIPKNGDDFNDRKRELEEELDKSEYMGKLEEQFKQPRIQLAQGFAGGFAALMLLGLFVKWIGILTTRFFGFAYPAYQSFKAIESKDKDDDTQWLIYWLIFAIFSILEETLLSPFEAYMPFFFVFKTVFLIWCFMPQTQGAALLWNTFLDPKRKRD